MPRGFAAVVSLVLLVGAGRSAAETAAAEPLWQTELRAGYGIAMGGAGARMSRRPTPLTLEANVLFAFNEDPSLWGYGGLLVETLDRNAVGTVFGVELRPRGSRLHVAGGGAWLVAPYMLFGATAAGGACFQLTRIIKTCGDLQVTAYFAGNDLADGRTVTQLQFMLGVVFDAI